MSVLTNNRNRFKCGREIKKRTTIWGLRVRLPPPAPCITLPPNGLINEDELREMWQGNRRLQFLPLDRSSAGKRIIATDTHMKNVMMGIGYQQNNGQSETDSPCPSPEIIREEPVVETLAKAVPKNNEYLGAGCAKKSVPFKKMSLQRRKKLLAMSKGERERILRRPKRRVVTESNKEKSDKEGQLKRLCIDNKATKTTEAMPPTPPTSVSAPPTPPASSSVVSDLSNDFSENSNLTKAATSSKKSHLLELTSELNTPCDTSGDETSSKSTLDQIIPPPKDFEGKNNPFLTLLRVSEDAQSKNKKKKDITLPLPLTAVIPG